MVDVSLTQWLALTPPDIVASTLKIPLSVVRQLKKEKQVLIAAQDMNQGLQRWQVPWTHPQDSG